MNISDVARISIQALGKNKARTLLTTLGIVIGVAAVIAMVSLGQGAQSLVQQQMQSMGTNVLFVTPIGQLCRRLLWLPGSSLPVTSIGRHVLKAVTNNTSISGTGRFKRETFSRVPMFEAQRESLCLARRSLITYFRIPIPLGKRCDYVTCRIVSLAC
jgi:hypothetical protein